MIDTRAIRMRWEADGSKRDERGQRLFAASEARAAYLMVWDALIAGRINVLEASQWLDVLQRVERHL
jgi:hypothetical protein